ncbi:MAG TPA: NAD(P)-binding domain-containing protein, partial [Thermoanaerobaculia bacterium]|nr:NAD(P)-binding domain-containing protein [Thermoanaerobaculia bacterium]
MRLGIIGGGRAAWAFGSTWRRLGWPLAGIARREGSASRVPELLGIPDRTREEVVRSSDAVLLAVTDRAIAEVAASLPETEAVIWHASGSIPHVRGGFSLHPLRVLPPVGEPADLGGTLFVAEGERLDV